MNGSIIEEQRFLIVAPARRKWDLGFYLEQICISKGIECLVFAYHEYDRQEANRLLLACVDEYGPDIMLGLKLDWIGADTLAAIRAAGVFIALWYVDCHTPEVPDWMARLLGQVDVFLTTAKGMIPKYEAICPAPVYWVYEGAYLPAYPILDLPEAKRRTYGSRVAFIGNIFPVPTDDSEIALRRQRLFDQIGAQYELRVWGPQAKPPAWHDDLQYQFKVTRWPAYNEEFVKVCWASEIMLGINTVNNVELYFSARTFMTLASGGFHITHYVPGLETMFENKKHLVWYQSNDQCIDLIGYYLDHPDERTRIAHEGQRLVRRRDSMLQQLDKILSIIDTHYADR